MKKEIEMSLDFINPKPAIDTIYFGGGTPSLLEASEINELLIGIKENFEIKYDAEVTLEINPDDVSAKKVMEWKACGINRYSIGVQSFDEGELSFMGRAHNSAEAYQAIELIKESGCNNFSVDLIYGSHLQTNEILLKNIEALIHLGVPHISAYALTTEPKTKLDHLIQSGILPPADSETQATHFEILVNTLAAHGYEQYEISNFSLPDYRSRHNASYWAGVPYYGFGPSAHSYNGSNIRRWNISNNALYIKAIENGEKFWEEELLCPEQRFNEMIMVGLRTSDGVFLPKAQPMLTEKQQINFYRTLKKYLSLGLVKIENDFLKLSPDGKFLADGIAADFFTD